MRFTLLSTENVSKMSPVVLPYTTIIVDILASYEGSQISSPDNVGYHSTPINACSS